MRQFREERRAARAFASLSCDTSFLAMIIAHLQACRPSSRGLGKYREEDARCVAESLAPNHRRSADGARELPDGTGVWVALGTDRVGGQHDGRLPEKFRRVTP